MIQARPVRRRPVHQAVFDRRGRSPIVFVTVCTAKRQRILANPAAATLLQRAWHAAQAWQVGRYVVMPDHVHLFCSPAVDTELRNWVHFWKAYVTRRWMDHAQRPLWQTGFWDTQLRGNETYAAKWEYVRFNPVRHGLVHQPESWPFQGELNVLSWD